MPGLTCGTCSASDTDVIDTQLGDDVCFVCCPGQLDTVGTVTSQTNGLVTVGVFDAGSAETVNKTMHWFAFHKSGGYFTSANTTYFLTGIPGFACGTATKDDGGTLIPFLDRRDACVFVASGETDDTIVTVTSQANGTLTLGIKTAAGAASTETIHWMAFATPSASDPEGSTPADMRLFNKIPGMSVGIAQCKDNGTIDTQLAETVCFVANACTADTVVNYTSQSNGVVTVDMETAGSDVGSDENVNWIAFHYVKK